MIPCHLCCSSNRVELRAATVLGSIALCTGILWAAGVLSWPSGLSILVVAYTLGLRHALDADHIAAIDNVTRRQLQSNQRPVTVGLMFSLGHSTVVLAATMLVAICSASINARFDHYRRVSDTLGSAISGGFLLLLGLINATAVVSIIRAMNLLKTGKDDPYTLSSQQASSLTVRAGIGLRFRQ